MVIYGKKSTKLFPDFKSLKLKFKVFFLRIDIFIFYFCFIVYIPSFNAEL